MLTQYAYRHYCNNTCLIVKLTYKLTQLEQESNLLAKLSQDAYRGHTNRLNAV